MDNKATLQTLNDLVQINNDRIEGYENALKQIQENELSTNVAEPELRIRFLSYIDQSRRFKLDMANEVQVLGSEVELDTSTSGKITPRLDRYQNNLYQP